MVLVLATMMPSLTQILSIWMMLPLVTASQLPLLAHITSAPIPVQVVLGVMSRCDDALLCEDVFNKVIAHVSPEKMNVVLEYIAQYV